MQQNYLNEKIVLAVVTELTYRLTLPACFRYNRRSSCRANATVGSNLVIGACFSLQVKVFKTQALS